MVPAEQISTLIEAGQILEKVKEESETYKKQTSSECEAIKETASQEGYEAGFSRWAEHLAKLEEQIDETKSKIQEIAIPLALKAARMIVGHQLEVDPQVTVDIVSNNLKSVSTHKKIVIWCNKGDLAVLEKHKNDLKARFEHLESFSLAERDDIDPGGCVIETEGGIINAQLSNKWENLENAFEKLLGEGTVEDSKE